MKKRATKVVSNGTQKMKKLQDMSVDDLMNSFGDSGSDSGSDEEQDLPKQAMKVNGNLNGHSKHQSDDDEESELESEESEDGSGEEEMEDEEYGEEEMDNEESGEEEMDNEESGEDEMEDEESGEDDLEDEGSGDEVEEEESGEGEEVDEDGSSGEETEGDIAVKHKKSLTKLKDIDPEFYKYLEENDKKLLQFHASDSEEDEDDNEEEEEDQVHHPPDKLDVDSDESDFDGEDGAPSKRQHGVITLKMVENWRQNLSTDKSVQTISDTIQAFHAALQRVASEEERSACLFKIESGAVFNAVVQMCVLDLLPALRKFLNLSAGSLSHANPVKCKRWPKVKTLTRSYCADLLQLLGGIASVNIATTLLKHLHQMTPFVVCFPNVTKHFLKTVISFWSTGEETVRVVAFMCILKATSLQQKALLDQVLRQMYMAYIQNSKFVSPNTLASINFMRRSLSEMFLLDENVSYHHAFLYIRQLAIHLRNAITLQKKESVQAVYNWQFISSLALWVELLGASSKQALQPLLYPVVQVTVGAIKLVPTAQYYPLRFNCARLLISLSRNTGTFVPVLPFLLEILNFYDFNKKHSKVSMKPLDISCVLRLSKAQQQENGFKDAVLENIYNLTFECLANESHSIAFPDLALPFIIQVRDFLKRCKVANYTRKMKQLLEKVEENAKFIERERKTAVIQLSDTKAIQDWETAVKVKGPPLAVFFNSWKQMNTVRQAKEKRDVIDISENLPKIIRPKKKNSAEGLVTMLPSDDSDSDNFGFDDDEDVPRKPRGKRGKRLQGKSTDKKAKVVEDLSDDGEDVVEDVNLSEW